MLTDKKKKIIAGVLEAQPDVAAAYLFGSQQRKTAGEDSDIDIGVLFKSGGVGLNRELELESCIIQAIGREADIRILNFDQSPTFLMQAAQGELLMGHDRPERVAFEIKLAKAYDDAQHYFRIAQNYI